VRYDHARLNCPGGGRERKMEWARTRCGHMELM